MHCPLCHEFISEGEDLQLHYLLNCRAYTGNKEPGTVQSEEGTALVRFRWAKVEPCVQRIVHLISSLAGSTTLHWSSTEGLYESALTTVPLGKHTCQLALANGDVIPVEDFEIEEETDVMYIIPVEEDDIEVTDLRENIIDEHDDPVADLLASTSFQDQNREGLTTDADLRVLQYDGDDEGERNEDLSDGDHGNPLELSPLYKELLQHQVLHGEPSWIPNSGNQSPTNSDQELEDLLQRSAVQEGPPLLTGEPAIPDDRLLKSPIPIKPFEVVEVNGRTEPGSHGDESINTGAVDNNVTKEKDESSSSSSSSSSATFSGSTSKKSSEHSSQRQSPPIHSDASDNSIPLQEQSLEEAIPQPEELPCPYIDKVLTSRPNNGPFETAPSNIVPATEHPRNTEGNHLESRASPHDRPPSSRSNQSETRASPQERPSSARSHQSETRASPYERPSSAKSHQSETRASPNEQPPSIRSNHSETRERSSSARSHQSETRASPHDHSLSARSNQSETRASPHEHPSSTRSNQSETRASPHEQPPSIRSNHSETRERPSSASSHQSETRTTPRDRPSSARSNQSDARASPHSRSPSSEVIALPLRRSSGSGNYVLSHDRHTPPPSPSEPSPSISHHSSTRSTPHDSIQGLYGRHDIQRHGYPIDGQPVHPTDSESLSHVPQGSHKGSPSARHQSPGSSLRHEESGPGALEDLKIVGHAIPSRSSAFSLTNGDEQEPSEDREIEVLRKERESLIHELSIRSASYENEIKELKALNEELCQQLLSLETAAAMAEQDIQTSTGLDLKVRTIEHTLAVKDAEIKVLKKQCNELEKLNQKMKEEQESLKTVNKLTYEDLNKVNCDLLAERSDLQRKTYGSPMRSLTNHDDVIPHIEGVNKTLRDKVDHLENEKRDLKHQYNETKLELEKTKTEKSISEFRLTKAKSEADLREKFDKFTNYKPTTDAKLYDVSTNKTDSSGLGTSRYTLSDTNFDTANKTSGHTLLNGSTTHLKYDGYSQRDDPILSRTSRRLRGPVDDDINIASHHFAHNLNRPTTHTHNRHRSLSSESSESSLLEYEYGANIRIPHEPTPYVPRDKRVELREPGTGRRTTRPHSFHAGTKMDSYLPDKHHIKSSSYTATRPLDCRTKPSDYRSNLSSSFTSDSSYGTTPYRTNAVKGNTGDYLSKPFMPTSSNEIRLGKRVVVTRSCGNVGRGVVRYVGSLPTRNGSYVGVELDRPEGKHDGSFQGTRLFRCEPNRGIFVKFDKVIMCYN